MKKVLFGLVAGGLVAALLTACGGGGGGASPATSSTTVSGVVSKGPLTGSTVCAYTIAGGAKGAQIGTCSITNSGNYPPINLGDYSGPVLFQATGGTYVNEADGRTVNLLSPLNSILPNAPGGNVAIEVAVTPLTEVAYQIASASAGGLTSANIQAAIAMVQNNFGVPDIVNTMPVDALNVPAGANAAQRRYALALAVVSQYVSGRQAPISLADGLRTMHLCLGTPSTCGDAGAQLGTLLFAAQTTFIASHPAFAGIPLPLATFGSRPSPARIVLVPRNPLPPARVGEAYAQSILGQINPPAPPASYSYSIDTLANGVLPGGFIVDLNGTIRGTPSGTGRVDVNGAQLENSYTFRVCATDTITRLSTSPCAQTSITVLPRTAPPIAGAGEIWANWNCGTSAQCAAVMGGTSGSTGLFCTADDCNAWKVKFFAGATCSATAIFTKRQSVGSNGVCNRNGIDF